MSRISLRVFWILLFPVATYASYIFLTETNAGCAVGDTNCVMLSGLAWMLAVVIAGILTAVHSCCSWRTCSFARRRKGNSLPEFAEDFANVEIVTHLPVDSPGRAVKVTITMEEHLLMRLNKATERQG